jgi:hypothetical protein
MLKAAELQRLQLKDARAQAKKRREEANPMITVTNGETVWYEVKIPGRVTVRPTMITPIYAIDPAYVEIQPPPERSCGEIEVTLEFEESLRPISFED